MSDIELPAVGGRRIDCSNAAFEHRCLVYLAREQAKLSPDNGMIALLCDAVRITREYSDNMVSRSVEGTQSCTRCGERIPETTHHDPNATLCGLCADDVRNGR